MQSEFIRCGDCGLVRRRHDMAYIATFEEASKYYECNMCLYCSHDRYFKAMGQANMRKYKIYGNDEILEMEIAIAKVRFVLRGEDETFVTFNKNIDMITKVSNSTELRQALNENLEALLTKKRKLLVVKEVNNTLGKILSDVKMELMQNALTGTKDTISWFEDRRKEIGEQYGVAPRIKQVV